MSRRVNVTSFIDDEYSSGDTNRANNKCQEGAKKAEVPPKCQEENNNEIDHLSRQLDEMGCIVDAVKRSPNICVENCVHTEDSESEDASEEAKTVVNKEDDAYSDEFEEASDAEDKTDKVGEEADGKAEALKGERQPQLEVKTAGSRASFVNVPKPVSVSSVSSYGSIPVPRTHRVNMSFSNDRLREIERHNHILLDKIVRARNNRASSIPPWDEAKRAVPTAALLRRKDQRKIDHENMILLKKIQRAKSSSCSLRH